MIKQEKELPYRYEIYSRRRDQRQSNHDTDMGRSRQQRLSVRKTIKRIDGVHTNENYNDTEEVEQLSVNDPGIRQLKSDERLK